MVKCANKPEEEFIGISAMFEQAERPEHGEEGTNHISEENERDWTQPPTKESDSVNVHQDLGAKSKEDDTKSQDQQAQRYLALRNARLLFQADE